MDQKKKKSKEEIVEEKSEAGDSAQETEGATSEAKSSEDNSIVLAADVLPDTLLIIPIDSRPLFPNIVMPIIVSGRFIKSVTIADGENKTLGIILLKKAVEETPEESDFYMWGIAAKIIGTHNYKEGSIQVLVRSIKRFKVTRFVRLEPNIVATVEYPDDIIPEDSLENKALHRSLIIEMQTIIKENQLLSNEMKESLQNIDTSSPGNMTDIAANLTSSSSKELQEVIETIDVKERMRKVLFLMKKEVDILRLQAQISEEIHEKISKQQREFFLREQLKVIKKELGIEMDDKTIEIKRIEEKLAELKLNEEVNEKINNDLQKLKLTESHSPEFGVIRNYLDIVISLPWGKYTRDITDLTRARRILNHDHYGLDDVKDRILEFIATLKMKKSVQGSMICLVGPPGVGKTSVGKSVARALNRKFYRFSLGGMRDEAEIKGHRRTYIGAMPGKIINAMKYCGAANPIIMLDEIDKLSHSFSGDPSSALLEVLDPEQNSTFIDHYLDIPFDLSRVLFITTANTLDTIPAPLLDRMEVMRLSGYVEKEKVEIGKRFLLPKQLDVHGLTKDHMDINKKALAKIAQDYAREAGVRNMEKNIATICRKVTVRFAGGDNGKIHIGVVNLAKYLGKPKFKESPLDKDYPAGVSTGLAWTSMGGAVLRIEALSVGKKKSLKQTGQLGDVMVESSGIAYSFISASIKKYGGEADFFENNSIHLHVPEGATPKDGPSAGITMATALISLALGKKVKKNLAMTGELTLTGNVLPIGGLREKVIAARRNKITEIIIPKQNSSDMEELKDYLKKGITFHTVEHFDEVNKLIFK